MKYVFQWIAIIIIGIASASDIGVLRHQMEEMKANNRVFYAVTQNMVLDHVHERSENDRAMWLEKRK